MYREREALTGGSRVCGEAEQYEERENRSSLLQGEGSAHKGMKRGEEGREVFYALTMRMDERGDMSVIYRL